MTPEQKIQILTDALRRITARKDAPPIDPSGDVQDYLNCEIGDRGPYEAAGFGYTEGVEDALVWAFNEAKSALNQINESTTP